MFSIKSSLAVSHIKVWKFPSVWGTFTAWRGWLPEKISFNSVATKASGIKTCIIILSTCVFLLVTVSQAWVPGCTCLLLVLVKINCSRRIRPLKMARTRKGKWNTFVYSMSFSRICLLVHSVFWIFSWYAVTFASS